MQGLGFVLSQERDGQLLPVRFGSRVLTETEQRYDATNRELLAVFYSVKQNEVYLFRSKYVVYTNNKQEATGFKICAPEHAQKNETNLP